MKIVERNVGWKRGKIMSQHATELVQKPYSMKPYISYVAGTKRKYPYRVMGYDTLRNRWFVWDAYPTLELAEGGLRKATRQYQGAK